MSVCVVCGNRSFSDYCFAHKPRKAMRQSTGLRKEAPKTRRKRLATARAWHQDNPPDENGEWECYLKISPNCHIKVNEETLNREHVLSKARHPEFKYDITNIKPACSPCNELKGSRNAQEFI